jgi:hypothetical protein
MEKKLNRTFSTGANRNSDEGKYDYEGFNNPIVDFSFAKYMHFHRKLEDGTMRDSDNWQKGMPKTEIVKSLIRHVQDIKLIHRGIKVVEDGKEVSLEHAINGAKFNLNALMLDLLKDVKEIRRNEN